MKTSANSPQAAAYHNIGLRPLGLRRRWQVERLLVAAINDRRRASLRQPPDGRHRLDRIALQPAADADARGVFGRDHASGRLVLPPPAGYGGPNSHPPSTNATEYRRDVQAP